MNSLFHKIKIMYWRWRWHHTKWIYVRKWEDCDPTKIETETGQMMTFPEYQKYYLNKIATSLGVQSNIYVWYDHVSRCIRIEDDYMNNSLLPVERAGEVAEKIMQVLNDQKTSKDNQS